MQSVVKTITLHTKQDMEIINITDIVKDTVAATGIQNGTVHIMTKHTTSGITVNEGLPDIEDDLVDMLQRLIPRNGEYRHARFLHSESFSSRSFRRGRSAGPARPHVRPDRP